MKSIILALAFLLSIPAFAVVDMKNANFSNSWVDIEVPGTGYDLKVTRTYNSKSLFDGIFGFGWCSDFETTLDFTAEGNIKITECGAGQEIYYTPRDFGKKDIDRTIAQIIAKMKAAKKGDAKTWASLSEEMITDHDLRSKFAFSYKVSVPVKDGSKFFANGREIENIVFSKGVYTRNLPDGSYMRFTQGGQLSHLYDKNGNFIKLDYKDGVVREMVDNNGRKLSFKYYNNKKVSAITGPNGLTAEYKFKGLNDLNYVKNAWKSVYTYDYDDLHNLVKATYPDNTSIALTYDRKNDWVMSFTDRERCQEKYGYEFDSKNPKLHYWSTVKKTCGKEVVNDSKHEFWYQERKDGQIFLQRVASTVNGNVTDITYHDVFGKPVAIRRNNDRYTFDYYPNGLVRTKNGEFTRLTFEYDTKSGKVSKVTTVAMNDKGKSVGTRNTAFRYDLKGNMVYAENTDGQKVTMTYDTKGRIASITDQAKKLVKIDYEERFGKPSVVTRPGLGVVKVSYKSNGEMDNVSSAEGPSVTMQIVSTFNNLLDVISPATAEVFN